MKKNLLFMCCILQSIICISQKIFDNSAQPDAVSWKTLILPSAHIINVPAPPGKETTNKEIRDIIALQKKSDTATWKEIHYWNAGSPAYRWQKIADDLSDTAQYWGRIYPYMNAAIYDATIAAWNAKYKYHRIRPSQSAGGVKNLISVPATPSYPCEHSVTAGAAATVLGYLFPSKKDSLLDLAKKAGESRIAAGVQYPSDVKAGFELGVKVAEQVIAYAVKDGYDKFWTDTLPKGREYYTGKPLKRDLAKTRPWILTSPDQFRSPPPPDIEKDMEEIRNFKHTDKSNSRAYKWEFSWPWGDVVDQKIFEYNLSHNSPRSAFIYAVISIADYENQLAHWDGKYTYYRARPDQYDTTFKALFKTPASPGYPAGHGTMAYTRAAVLSYLFPYDREQFYEMAKEANESRFEAGVHFRSDNIAGEALGRKIGEEVIKWAKKKVNW